jgi:hypothetical protein
MADSYRKKRHGQKVSRCGLILRVGNRIIKPDTQQSSCRDWFGGGKRVSCAPMPDAAHPF